MTHRIRYIKLRSGHMLLNLLDEWDNKQCLEELERFGGKSMMASLQELEDGRVRAYVYDEDFNKSVFMYYPSQIDFINYIVE